MTQINWNPNASRIRQPTFNPNAGLALAQKSFAGINESFAADEKAAALAANRAAALEQQNASLALATRKQDFAEGSTQLLRDQNIKNVTSQMEAVDLAGKVANTARPEAVDAYMSSPEVTKLMQTDEGRKQVGAILGDYAKSAYSGDISDNTTSAAYRESIFKNLANSGMSPADITAFADSETKREFSGGRSFDETKDLANLYYGSGPQKVFGASGGGNRGSADKLNTVQTMIASKKYMDEQLDQYNDNDKIPFVNIDTDINNNNLTKKNLKAIIAKGSLQNIDPVAMYSFIDYGFKDPGDTTSIRGLDFDNLTKDQTDLIIQGAKQYQTQQSGTASSAEQSILIQQANNNRIAGINKLFAGVGPNKGTTNKQITDRMMSALGQSQVNIAPKADKPAPTKNDAVNILTEEPGEGSSAVDNKIMSSATKKKKQKAEFNIGLTKEEIAGGMYSTPEDRKIFALRKEQLEAEELEENAKIMRNRRKDFRLMDMFIPRSGISGFRN